MLPPDPPFDPDLTRRSDAATREATLLVAAVEIAAQETARRIAAVVQATRKSRSQEDERS